ncbi:hypothetical protein Tco_0634629 [Tanacetum coccineum]
MAVSAVFVFIISPEECFGETIEIGVDATRPVPVTSTIFPTSTEELRILRDRADIAEAEMATLCATISTIGTVETSLRNRMRDKRQTRIKIER